MFRSRCLLRSVLLRYRETDTAEDDDTAQKSPLPSQSDETAADSADAENVSTRSLVEGADGSADSATDYSAMTVTELKSLAKSKGISGYSTMTKSELIEALSAN